MAIISMAQHASPNDMGQMELLRAQLMALPSVVVRMLSSIGPADSLSILAKKSSGTPESPVKLNRAELSSSIRIIVPRNR